jgi:hypothetical protein
MKRERDICTIIHPKIRLTMARLNQELMTMEALLTLMT